MGIKERLQEAEPFECPKCGSEKSCVERTIQGEIVDGEPGVARIRECRECGELFRTVQESPGACSACGSRWFEVTHTRTRTKSIWRRHRCANGRCRRGVASTHETIGEPDDLDDQDDQDEIENPF